MLVVVLPYETCGSMNEKYPKMDVHPHYEYHPHYDYYPQYDM